MGVSDIDTRDDTEMRRLRNADSRARFNEIVGPVPSCTPGDRRRAAEYLERIETALGQHGWSPSIQNRLYRLREKWKARADGRDYRFEVMGNVCRPPTDRERDQIKMLQANRALREIASGL